MKRYSVEYDENHVLYIVDNIGNNRASGETSQLIYFLVEELNKRDDRERILTGSLADTIRRVEDLENEN